jgi:hypothetical protein
MTKIIISELKYRLYLNSLKRIFRNIILSALLLQVISVTAFRVSIINELFQMGQLVNHFHAHESENPEMTIWTFIQIHYINETLVDEDYAEDMKLPFKTSEKISGPIVAKIFPESFDQMMISIESSDSFIEFFGNQFIAQDITRNIWQPPRLS